MGAENLLVRNPGRPCLGQGLDRCSRVSGICYGSHTARIAGREPPTGGLDVLRGAPGSLQLAEPANPYGEIAFRHLAFEAGEFQMSVSVDQTWQNDGVFELHGRNTMGSRNDRIGTDGLEPPVRSYQNRAMLDSATVNRDQPSCG
jgi:hypothetical protein